jgi:hypothetical protein
MFKRKTILDSQNMALKTAYIFKYLLEHFATKACFFFNQHEILDIFETVYDLKISLLGRAFFLDIFLLKNPMVYKQILKGKSVF